MRAAGAGGPSNTTGVITKVTTMHKMKRGVRRLAALLVGCGAAGLVIGWTYERPPAPGYSRMAGR